MKAYYTSMKLYIFDSLITMLITFKSRKLKT